MARPAKLNPCYKASRQPPPHASTSASVCVSRLEPRLHTLLKACSGRVACAAGLLRAINVPIACHLCPPITSLREVPILQANMCVGLFCIYAGTCPAVAGWVAAVVVQIAAALCCVAACCSVCLPWVGRASECSVTVCVFITFPWVVTAFDGAGTNSTILIAGKLAAGACLRLVADIVGIFWTAHLLSSGDAVQAQVRELKMSSTPHETASRVRHSTLFKLCSTGSSGCCNGCLRLNKHKMLICKAGLYNMLPLYQAADGG
jgi:hypothetical protein